VYQFRKKAATRCGSVGCERLVKGQGAPWEDGSCGCEAVGARPVEWSQSHHLNARQTGVRRVSGDTTGRKSVNNLATSGGEYGTEGTSGSMTSARA